MPAKAKTKAKTEKVPRLALYVAELRGWNADSMDYGWYPLTGVRPSVDKGKVFAQLDAYRAKRRSHRAGYSEYRVARYTRTSVVDAEI